MQTQDSHGPPDRKEEFQRDGGQDLNPTYAARFTPEVLRRVAQTHWCMLNPSELKLIDLALSRLSDDAAEAIRAKLPGILGVQKYSGVSYQLVIWQATTTTLSFTCFELTQMLRGIAMWLKRQAGHQANVHMITARVKIAEALQKAEFDVPDVGQLIEDMERLVQVKFAGTMKANERKQIESFLNSLKKARDAYSKGDAAY